MRNRNDVDPFLFVRHEKSDPLHARVWFTAIDDPRLKTKAHLTLYVALCRVADFESHDVETPEGDPTGQRGHQVAFPKQARRSFLMAKARIGGKVTFYRVMADLIAAKWVRRDYVKDAPFHFGSETTYRDNWPPCYTLIRPPDRPTSTHRR